MTTGIGTKTHKCRFYQESEPKTCDEFHNCEVTCDQTHVHYCVTMFKYKNGTFQPAWAGCMTDSSEVCRNNKVTTDSCHLEYYKLVGTEHHSVCCCVGDLCNVNNVFNHTLMTPPPPTTSSKTF